MFRPNRIGDHSVVDTSAAGFVIDPSTANFVTNLGDRDDFFVQTNEVTLQDEISTVDFDTGKGDVVFVVGDQKSWSFGTFVNGLALNDRPMMLSYSVNVMIHLAAASNSFELAAFLGRLNGTDPTVDKTAQTNNMRTAISLARRVGTSSIQADYLNVQGTIIDTIENGGLAGVFDTDPIGLWFSLISHSGAPTCEHISGSLSLYRYAKDIDTFDPNR